MNASTSTYEPIVATCGCGRKFTDYEFVWLPKPPHGEWMESGRPDTKLQLRNCRACGSTISRTVPK